MVKSAKLFYQLTFPSVEPGTVDIRPMEREFVATGASDYLSREEVMAFAKGVESIPGFRGWLPPLDVQIKEIFGSEPHGVSK
jgi:hypothetical protein